MRYYMVFPEDFCPWAYSNWLPQSAIDEGN